MADDGDAVRDGKNRVGLCVDCVHSRRVESSRGSVFWLCELSASDPRFPKYPRLPVLSCSGYEKRRAELKRDSSGLKA